MNHPRDDSRWSAGRSAILGFIALGVITLLVVRPPSGLLASAFSGADRGPSLSIGRAALGASGMVRIQVRAPLELFDFPVEPAQGSGPLQYQWVKAEDSVAMTPDTALVGTTVVAPRQAGFYNLRVTSSRGRRILDSVLVAVLVPFSEKLGNTLNGYRIGTWRWERAKGDATPPPKGFIEVWERDADMPVSAHLRVSDFLTHDEQAQWPRYVVIDPRILDKVELVLDYLGVRDHRMPLDVHSGFRTPLHNRRVPRAAGDSRHQYGDAVDVALDADGDGRISYLDVLAVARAVEQVEKEHPDLVGGLGVYGNRGTAPYVHIDVRGTRSRWRG